MNWILYFISFILGGIVIFMTICIGYAAKQEEPVNRVHFYVARDKDGTLYLYLGKPIRDTCTFSLCRHGAILISEHFSKYGLNKKDYANLKWEDEPVEVFINMED